MYWMVTNRNIEGNGFGGSFADLTYWKKKQDDPGGIAQADSWDQLQPEAFRQALVQVTDTFPHPLGTASEDQKHVNIFVHGFDDSWSFAVQRYAKIVGNLFSGPNSLGECILFTWPSQGSPAGYLPDRDEARKSAEDLADVLSDLYDWMTVKQKQAANDPRDACKAKTSMIAHSMGNYVLENAMNVAWTRKNRPLLVSLISEVIMVAADVDNDIFSAGDSVKHGDGEGIANLSYRITAMYSGRDSVLGMSAGLKHFGKRRLGRSGLDRTCPIPDNVWDIDCSTLLEPALNGIQVHSAYFDEPKCYALMRDLLNGTDRTVLLAKDTAPAALPRQQATSNGA
jgi:esterase/lipase superfamily enzyme